MFIRANPGYSIASFISSLSPLKSFEYHIFANQHPASVASCRGIKGDVIFPSGVVFVLAQIGVVGLACPVVRA